MKVTHWQGCTTDRTHTWAGRRYCRGCGVWLDPTPDQPWRAPHPGRRMGADNTRAGSMDSHTHLPGSATDNGGPHE